MDCVTAILFQTNMPESRQNNARHQLSNWSATFMQWTWEKPEQWTGNRCFFTPPPTSFPGFSPNRPYLSRSVETGRREPWERGCFSPCFAHRTKCRFDLVWFIMRLLNGLIPRAIPISTKKILSRSACGLTAAHFARNHWGRGLRVHSPKEGGNKLVFLSRRRVVSNYHVGKLSH